MRAARPGQVAGLMRVNVQIPSGVPPGGYVPVVLQGSSQQPGGVDRGRELRSKAMLFLWIALVLSTIARPMCGQTISFLRELSPGRGRATGVAVDATGVYTVAWEYSPRVGFARKHDARGNELWSRRFENSEVVGVAVDATGVYVVGHVYGGSEGDVFVSKLSSQGSLLWTRQVARGGGAKVAPDNSGIYVAWTSLEGPLPAGFVRQYTAEGDVLWTASSESSGAMAADATGFYLAAGGAVGERAAGFLRRYTAGGQELWARRFDLSVSGMAADASGVYLVDIWSGFLRKYSAGGDELWTRPLGTNDSGAAVAVDASGVYVGGFVDRTLPGQCATGSDDAVVRRYTAADEEVWTRQFGLQADDAEGEFPSAAVAVDAGSVYLTGYTGQARTLLARIEKAPVVIPATRPHMYWECVVNAASYVGGGVAPGEMVTIFGSAMGPSELVRLRLAEDGRLATTLADTRILFNGVPAPLLYVSDKQSGAIVPYAVAGRPAVEGSALAPTGRCFRPRWRCASCDHFLDKLPTPEPTIHNPHPGPERPEAAPAQVCRPAF